MKYLSISFALLFTISLADTASAHSDPTQKEALWDLGDLHGYRNSSQVHYYDHQGLTRYGHSKDSMYLM